MRAVAKIPQMQEVEPLKDLHKLPEGHPLLVLSTNKPQVVDRGAINLGPVAVRVHQPVVDQIHWPQLSMYWYRFNCPLQLSI